MTMSKVWTREVSNRRSSYPSVLHTATMPVYQINKKRMVIRSAATREIQQMVLMCLWVDIPHPSLSHVLAVITDENSTLDAVHLREDVDEIGVVVLKTDFQIEFDTAFLSGFALDYAFGYLFFQKLFCVQFTLLIPTVEYYDVGIVVRFSIDKYQ